VSGASGQDASSDGLTDYAVEIPDGNGSGIDGDSVDMAAEVAPPPDGTASMDADHGDQRSDEHPPAVRRFDGPNGAYILAAIDSMTISADCPDIPSGLFSQMGGCMSASSTAVLDGSATVCFRVSKANPNSVTAVVHCSAASSTSKACTSPDVRLGGGCCSVLKAETTPADPFCGDSVVLGEFAEGTLRDTDGDLVPDITDNCPLIQNIGQDDADSDGIGDACDNCLYTYNPDQASAVDGGVGNACDCTLPGVALDRNGCPCSDGGGGSRPDSGEVCGLVITADGGASDAVSGQAGDR
jgi:hypothetical protein